MKFNTGDTVDGDHCTVLTHEFFRCDDSFKEFARYAEQMIIQGQTREISYRTYNAYTNFIHHLYEFLMGCHARDAGNTEITNKKGRRTNQNNRRLCNAPCSAHHGSVP